MRSSSLLAAPWYCSPLRPWWSEWHSASPKGLYRSRTLEAGVSNSPGPSYASEFPRIVYARNTPFPRRPLLGSLVHKGLGGRRPTQVRWGLGPKVLQLLRCGFAAEDLVAVRVATEARYHVAGSLGLRDLELGPRPAVGRHVGRFFLGVENAALLEGEVLRVTQRKPEEKTLRGPQLTVHPQLDAFDG